MTSWLLNEARNRSIRSHAAGITVPPGLDDRAKILVGVTHFADHCAVCHGAPGVEQGEGAERLYPRPPKLLAEGRFYTPSELFWIIKHGIKMSGMPAWGDHSDGELWATVAFIEKLPGMTEQDYANLVATSREQGGHHREGNELQPQPGMAQPPGGLDHDQPAGHRH